MGRLPEMPVCRRPGAGLALVDLVGPGCAKGVCTCVQWPGRAVASPVGKVGQSGPGPVDYAGLANVKTVQTLPERRA